MPFLEQPLLNPDQQENYIQPQVSQETAPIYEHCARAIDRSLAVGQHGLPLMGAGDWNDGMNRVGISGKGESVWLGWFLYTTLATFTPHVDAHKEKARSDRYREHLENLRKSLEEKAWDGDWYRRAYFDDGTPLGSARNEECRIDSIAQSWAVISGASDPYRMGRAMAAVEEYLIRRGDGLVILFTPPFDKGSLDPGYIKGYVPGVRENGGQYTHAAIWTMIAYSMLGDGERAGELFSLLNPINHSSTRAGCTSTKSSLMLRWAMFTRCRRTLVVVAGRGTRDRRVGCIAPDWSRCSDSNCKRIDSRSIRVCRAGGATSRSFTAAGALFTGSKSRTRWV